MRLVSFRPVASVRTVEQGASSRTIDGLAFDATQEAQLRMADYRLLCRPRPGGFQIYGEHDAPDGEPIAAITEPVRLVFSIRPHDRHFIRRYKPLDGEAAAPTLYLTNQDEDGTPRAGGALSRGPAVAKEDMVRLVPRRTRAAIPLGGAPTSLELRRRFGGERVGPPIALSAADGAVAHVPLDVTADEANAFVLVPKPAGAAQAIVAHDETVGAFGALELVLKAFPGPAPAAGRDFTVTFESRES